MARYPISIELPLGEEGNSSPEESRRTAFPLGGTKCCETRPEEVVVRNQN